MSRRNPGDLMWLKGNGGTEFLQFSHARITRSQFPLGVYLYVATTSEVEPVRLYSGSSYDAALTALRRARTEWMSKLKLPTDGLWKVFKAKRTTYITDAVGNFIAVIKPVKRFGVSGDDDTNAALLAAAPLLLAELKDARDALREVAAMRGKIGPIATLAQQQAHMASATIAKAEGGRSDG